MSEVSDEETKLRMKLKTLTLELARSGTVKGFLYFTMYLRGKEELIVSVVNKPLTPDNSYCSETTSPLASSFTSNISVGDSFSSGNLPYDKRSLMLSARTQKNLSGYGDVGVGLPPASPSEFEPSREDENSTLFLLAAYNKYSCPYVWVRSNHERIVKLSGEQDEDRDNPLKLKSTQKWLKEDVKLWDIVAELVKLCTSPVPLNPFTVDFSYFDQLPQNERLIASGAMINFLQKVIASKVKDRPYTAKVFEDLQRLTRLHFEILHEMASTGAVPSLKMALNETGQRTSQWASEQASRATGSYTSQQRPQKHVMTSYTSSHHGYKYQTGML